MKELIDYYFDNQESASYNKSNPEALTAMITSLKYIENQYKDNRDFVPIIKKVKTNKYVKFISISKNDKELLKIIFKNNIDYLFTPWNLLKHTYKSRALKIFIMYLKTRVLTIF